MAQKYDKPEIRIQFVNLEVYSDLKNISKNLGISMASMLKPHLYKIRDSYPIELRRKPRD